MLRLMLRQMPLVITPGAKHYQLSGFPFLGSNAANIIKRNLNAEINRNVLYHTRLVLLFVIASLGAAFDIEFDP
jgi:hypothetical protein